MYISEHIFILEKRCVRICISEIWKGKGQFKRDYALVMTSFCSTIFSGTKCLPPLSCPRMLETLCLVPQKNKFIIFDQEYMFLSLRMRTRKFWRFVRHWKGWPYMFPHVVAIDSSRLELVYSSINIWINSFSFLMISSFLDFFRESQTFPYFYLRIGSNFGF